VGEGQSFLETLVGQEVIDKPQFSLYLDNFDQGESKIMFGDLDYGFMSELDSFNGATPDIIDELINWVAVYGDKESWKVLMPTVSII
jgi:hypothetical protein